MNLLCESVCRSFMQTQACDMNQSVITICYRPLNLTKKPNVDLRVIHLRTQ